MPNERDENDRNNEQDRGRQASSSEEQSLKEREYRDKNGEVHHHTRTYEQQHDEHRR